MTGVRIAAAGALALALAASACIGPGDFRCTEHAQCTVGSQPGFCEVNGHCSVADDRCLPSHRRYVHQAGDDADACVSASCGGNAITAVSAGGGHACLVRDHNLWCWGRNDRGQLGDGTRTPHALPVRVAGVSNVVAVATGDGHTCAAQGGGPVFCWGANDAGQLGDGGVIDHGLPQEVAGVTGATALAAGKDFSCAFSDGTVRCWGDDSVGQLGDGGAAGPPRLPVAIAGVTGVTALSASWRHACAVHGGGQLTCWGANDQGQIGDGTQTAAHAPTALTALLPTPALPSTIRKVVTGHDHTCALADDGLRCWGGNGQGQVDPAGSGGAIPTPREIMDAGLADPLDVAAGAQHTCIIKTGGDGEHPVSCWGANGSDQRDADPPVADATEVVAGATFSCAVASDGALYCWGDNHFGQLASGGDIIRPTPARVPSLAHANALAAGGAHNCATADDAGGARALYCWGANGSGQLGNGSSTDATAATRISLLQPGTIAAGAAHTCAFPADRELRCWGSGTSGQLGQSPGVDGIITIPTVTDLGGAQGGDGVFAVAAGAWHTCVGATISASVLCFGLNTDGQLGGPSGQSPWALVPSFLGNGKPQALAAGEAHSCALDGDGAIWCWGRGDEGQLGDGLGVDRVSPTVAVALGDGVAAAAIAAGARHTCALAGGKILCWGRNGEGQLGAPLPAPRLEPTEVSGLSQPRAIAAGERHTCAIDDDATVRCWGANESGQLGNGKTEASNVPVPVAGLTDVDAIVTGRAHSCARRTDGSVWCWGANTSGQLGDGVTLTSARPLLARIGCE